VVGGQWSEKVVSGQQSVVRGEAKGVIHAELSGFVFTDH
jgi:hypothetical protein